MPVIKTNASAILGVPVDDTDKGANKILKYNATSGKFEYEVDATADPGAGATQLSELSDVNTSTPTSGNYLRADGVDWESAAIAAGDLPTAIDAAKIADGSVSNTEFQYVNGVTSAIQTQLNAKAASTHAHAAGDITSGTLAVAQGGTNAATAADARTSLGLVIGTNVQAYDATLTALATTGTAANKVPYFTATDTGGELTLRTTLRAEGVADDTSLATEAAVRSAIGSAAGDVSSNTSSSVVNELAVFANTGGKLIARSTESGIAKLTSGVMSVVTAPSGTIVGTSDTQTLTNKTLQDSTTVFQDNADATKQFRFEASSVTAGQTRVLTVPNADLTLATLTGTETFTNKTLTNPTVNAAGGTVVVPTSASPAQTAEGSVVWDSDDDLLTVGDGSSRKVLVDTTSTQTLAAKTLTTPTIAATGFTNANHAHSATNSGGKLDLTAVASNTPTARYALIANSTGSAWETRALVIADISDVTTATGTQNDMLVKGASTWETKSPGQVRTVLQIGLHPTTTVDNTVSRYDGTTGDLQASSVTIDDSNNVAAAGHLTLGGGAASSEVRILEPSGGGSSYTGFKAPALAGNVVYTLPTADGTDGQVLKTNGSGALAWITTTGSGDVLGPATSADNTLTRFDGTDSKTIQASTLTVSDTGVIAAASGTLTLTSPYLTTPQINDTSADHQYVVAVGELSADRTVTLPVLTGADTFVFEAHTQNLTNKTINKVTVTAPASAATLTLADGSSLITSGAYPVTLTATATTGVQLPTTGTLATLAGTETLSGKTLTAPKITNSGFIADANGNEQIKFVTTASAVNELQVTNAATGSGVTLETTGGDDNVDLLLVAKGTGVVKADGNRVLTVGSGELSGLTAKTTTALDDIIVIEDSAASYAKKKITMEAFLQTFPIFQVEDVDMTVLGNGTTRGNAKFSTVGVTVGETRTLTIPNFDGTIATLAGTETLSGKTLTAPKLADGGFIADANGNEGLMLATTASAITYAKVTPGGTGVAPIIAGAGETDTGLTLSATGTGSGSVVKYISKGVTFTLPSADGSDGHVIKTNASGVLAFADTTTLVSAASDTTAGKVELATAAETTTGTDSGRAITPDGLAGSDYGKRVVGIQVFDAATDCATGDGKAFFRIPATMNGWNLVAVAMSCYTAGTTGTMDVQIRNKTDSQDMLSTKLTIDSTETDTSTAATAAVINASYDDVATGDCIAIDVDAVQTTKAKGLFVEMTFQLP